MSGHNKWSTIKHKKAAVDSKRGQLFTKLIKEVTVAARLGGGDPDANPRLRSAITTARNANMPKENLERAIKKGTGELEGVEYIEVTYEGYAAGGVAVFVECMTDNKNRTVGEIRHAFSRCNGNLGLDGSVAWMFDRKGQIVIGDEETEIDEDELMMAALEAGAEDVESDEGMFFVTTDLADLHTVRAALEEKYPIQEAKAARIAQNMIACDAGISRQVMRLVDLLEDNEDVQAVFHNAEFDETFLSEL